MLSINKKSWYLYIKQAREHQRREVSTASTRRDSVAALAVVMVRYSQQYWGILRAAGWLPGRILRSPTCRCRGRAHRGCWLAGSRAWWRGRSGDRTLTARNDCSLLTWVLQMSLLEKKRWIVPLKNQLFPVYPQHKRTVRTDFSNKNAVVLFYKAIKVHLLLGK